MTAGGDAEQGGLGAAWQSDPDTACTGDAGRLELLADRLDLSSQRCERQGDEAGRDDCWRRRLAGSMRRQNLKNRRSGLHGRKRRTVTAGMAVTRKGPYAFARAMWRGASADGVAPACDLAVAAVCWGEADPNRPEVRVQSEPVLC